MESVLFVCTGNSARSILAEAWLNHLGGARFRADSAGSRPVGRVHPQALAQIARFAPDYPQAQLRSKSWDEFAATHAAPFDLVVTVCDNAAGEACPHYPGAPLRAHWGFADPAAAAPAQQAAAFAAISAQIETRIRAFLELPWENLDQAARKAALAQLIQSGTAA